MLLGHYKAEKVLKRKNQVSSQLVGFISSHSGVCFYAGAPLQELSLVDSVD